MFTVEQYRSKARVYEMLLKTACSPTEAAEYRDLQQSYTSLADNLDWLAANSGKTVPGEPKVERRRRKPKHTAQPEPGDIEQENILRCLGGAVILNWNTIPTKLQRALFEAASTIQGAQTAPLRDVLAQFLHDHKNDAQRALEQADAGTGDRS
jgi:hypothetical protein